MTIDKQTRDLLIVAAFGVILAVAAYVFVQNQTVTDDIVQIKTQESETTESPETEEIQVTVEETEEDEKPNFTSFCFSVQGQYGDSSTTDNDLVTRQLLNNGAGSNWQEDYVFYKNLIDETESEDVHLGLVCDTKRGVFMHFRLPNTDTVIGEKPVQKIVYAPDRFSEHYSADLDFPMYDGFLCDVDTTFIPKDSTFYINCNFGDALLSINRVYEWSYETDTLTTVRDCTTVASYNDPLNAAAITTEKSCEVDNLTPAYISE